MDKTQFKQHLQSQAHIATTVHDKMYMLDAAIRASSHFRYQTSIQKCHNEIQLNVPEGENITLFPTLFLCNHLYTTNTTPPIKISDDNQTHTNATADVEPEGDTNPANNDQPGISIPPVVANGGCNYCFRQQILEGLTNVIEQNAWDVMLNKYSVTCLVAMITIVLANQYVPISRLRRRQSAVLSATIDIVTANDGTLLKRRGTYAVVRKELVDTLLLYKDYIIREKLQKQLDDVQTFLSNLPRDNPPRSYTHNKCKEELVKLHAFGIKLLP